MPDTPSSAPSSAEATDPLGTVKLLGAWLFVGLPAAWGIFQVVKKSMALFQ